MRDGEGSTSGWSGGGSGVAWRWGQGTQPASGIAPPGSREVLLKGVFAFTPRHLKMTLLGDGTLSEK